MSASLSSRFKVFVVEISSLCSSMWYGGSRPIEVHHQSTVRFARNLVLVALCFNSTFRRCDLLLPRSLLNSTLESLSLSFAVSLPRSLVKPSVEPLPRQSSLPPSPYLTSLMCDFSLIHGVNLLGAFEYDGLSPELSLVVLKPTPSTMTHIGLHRVVLTSHTSSEGLFLFRCCVLKPPRSAHDSTNVLPLSTGDGEVFVDWSLNMLLNFARLPHVEFCSIVNLELVSHKSKTISLLNFSFTKMFISISFRRGQERSFSSHSAFMDITLSITSYVLTLVLNQIIGKHVKFSPLVYSYVDKANQTSSCGGQERTMSLSSSKEVRILMTMYHAHRMGFEEITFECDSIQLVNAIIGLSQVFELHGIVSDVKSNSLLSKFANFVVISPCVRENAENLSLNYVFG
ncbi:unnamed protein product [Cochlearia groenlandica]